MRKYIIGMFFGIALTLSATTYAADITDMIGQVVKGSFPLMIDGVKAEKDVIVVNDTSYIPVRVAGQIFGYDISFLDSQVILKRNEAKLLIDAANAQANADRAKQDQATNEEKTKQDNLKNKSAKDLNDKITLNKNQIDTAQREIVRNQDTIELLKKMYAGSSNVVDMTQYDTRIKDFQAQITSLSQENDDLQKQLDALNATPTPNPSPDPSPSPTPTPTP